MTGQGRMFQEEIEFVMHDQTIMIQGAKLNARSRFYKVR